MDNNFTDKYRTIGIYAVIIFTALIIFFSFYQLKEKKQVALSLRSFYTEMTQALLLTIGNNGSPADWNWKPGETNKEIVDIVLKNRFIVEKSCLEKADFCFPHQFYKTPTNVTTTVMLNQVPSVILSNGMSLGFHTVSKCLNRGDVCSLLFIDINGIDGPNAFARDLFVFSIINSESVPLVPYDSRLSVSVLANDKKFGCNKDSEVPMYCSGLIFHNNWRIDEKYPW